MKSGMGRNESKMLYRDAIGLYYNYCYTCRNIEIDSYQVIKNIKINIHGLLNQTRTFPVYF